MKFLDVEILRVPVFLSQLSTVPEVVGDLTSSPSRNSLSLSEMLKIGKCLSAITLPEELNLLNSPINSPLDLSNKPSIL